MTDIAPLTGTINVINYVGDVVFAISGALTAARYNMDVLGFILIGTITGIGGDFQIRPALEKAPSGPSDLLQIGLGRLSAPTSVSHHRREA